MKRLVIRLLIVVVILVVVAVVAVSLSLDAIVKKGVETAGPAVTKVEVRLASVKISPFSGSGQLAGLLVGNPPGYKSDFAIKAGEISVRLKPASLIADKLVIEEILVQAPEITFEGSLRGNNLGTILDHIKAFTGGEQGAAKPAEKKAEKKLEVDRFVITGAKVTVGLTELGGQTTTLTLPDINLKDLGTGPDGITGSELAMKVGHELVGSVTESVTKNLTELLKGVTDVKNLGKEATQQADKITKGVKDLFKKKP